MFSNYLVLNETPKEVLYLFINNYGDFKKYYKVYNKKNNLLQEVKHYLKTNKIKFKGKIINIVLEGIIIDTINT